MINWSNLPWENNPSPFQKSKNCSFGDKFLEIDLSKNSENSWTEIRSLRLNPNKPAKYLTLVTEESRVEGKKNTERNPKNLRKHLSSIRLSRKIQSGIDTDFYEKITKKFLDDFYPKKCTNPACEERILDKEISTRPDIIRCSKCHQQQSRLSYTPLMALKLPLYMFGVVFHESFLQFPKVLTATEISKRLGIEYKSALKLKRRFQLFCSDQLPKYKALTFKALEEEYRGFKLDPNTETDVAPKMGLKPYVSADACVLYSTSQRANKGRSRYRHGGLTSSIYMSKNLGGKQIGTLVHGICVQNGPAFFESVSDTKANTIGPLLVEQIPYSVPLFTDQGYPWLYNIYKNHRSVNHSSKSKESRSGFSRNRWQKHNIHSQSIEGNFRLLKSSFSSYCYIKPEYSKLYLDEFSFIKTAKFFGLDCITEGCLGSQFSWEGRTAGAGSATVVRIGQEK